MDWNEYKSLCDRPYTFSRWMLEQTIALVCDETQLAEALASVLGRAMLQKPLQKPDGHRGGPETDMFDVRLDAAQARAIHRLVQQAALAGRRTAATQQRGLGGFEAAWREYLIFVEAE